MSQDLNSVTLLSDREPFSKGWDDNYAEEGDAVRGDRPPPFLQAPLTGRRTEVQSVADFGASAGRNMSSLNLTRAAPLPTPGQLRELLPRTLAAERTVRSSTEALTRILTGEDKRLLLVVGPCSIHDSTTALEYGRRLRTLAEEVKGSFLVVMRTYFEEPRTTVGWKGLLNDPYLDGSHRAEEGLMIARRLLLQLTEMGIPCATEFLGLCTPHYLGDLLTWSAVGARTSEAQTYRELASALPIPVGFKNGTDGSVRTAIHAVQTASRPACFVGTDPDTGRPALLASRGNRHAHIVLRGGADGPNCDRGSIAGYEDEMRRAGLAGLLVVDASHGNSRKDHRLQPAVFDDCVGQIAEGNRSIVGLMLESNLMPGAQALPGKPALLHHGVSITDACLGWDSTAKLIRAAHRRLKGILPVRPRGAQPEARKPV
jgi:3-deoxy-7-phosphoheptulonate synthase